MKRLITLLLSTTLFLFVHTAFADLTSPRVILVQNNTDETVTVQSAISATFLSKIKINGSDTPALKIGPHSQNHFIIENTNSSEEGLSGEVIFELPCISHEEQQPQASFPLTIGGSPDKYIRLDFNPYAYSNSEFAVAAVWLNVQDGILEIYPATDGKSAKK